MSAPTIFLTGSHAYGVPHDESDVDLVVFMPASVLQSLVIAQGGELRPGEYDDKSVSFRFGVLNLIAVVDEERLEEWWEGTQALVARRPVTREEAVVEFAGRFKKGDE